MDIPVGIWLILDNFAHHDLRPSPVFSANAGNSVSFYVARRKGSV